MRIIAVINSRNTGGLKLKKPDTSTSTWYWDNRNRQYLVPVVSTVLSKPPKTVYMTVDFSSTYSSPSFTFDGIYCGLLQSMMDQTPISWHRDVVETPVVDTHHPRMVRMRKLSMRLDNFTYEHALAVNI